MKEKVKEGIVTDKKYTYVAMCDGNEKNVLLSEISKRNEENSLEKLQNGEVAILGAGGLGSNVAVMLARSSVGRIYILDFDEVEASNLNRQVYGIKHIGMKKTEALKNIIKEINPFVEVEVKNIKITQDNISEIIKNRKIIVEAFDNADTKAMVVNEILENHPDKIIISGSGMAGVEGINNIKTKKVFKNLYLCGDGYSDYEEYSGIMSPKVTICAAHQANTAIKIILEKM